MKVLVFSTGQRKAVPFSYDERIVIEDGITTIRPIRRGRPGSTEKELEQAFTDFRTAIENNTLWIPKDGSQSEEYVQEDFELDFSQQQ